MNTPVTKLHLREAAAYLGIGYSTLRKWIALRRIGVESLGYRTKFVYIDELDAFLRNHQSVRRSTKEL